MKILRFAFSICLFAAVAVLWVLDIQRASATCPDPNCNGICSHVCAWDFNPQSTTSSGSGGSFSQNMTFEWCLTCPSPFGYSDWVSSSSVNVHDATADPGFFYLTTCSGSITINISGHMATGYCSGSVVTEGEVGDTGHGGICTSNKTLTINCP